MLVFPTKIIMSTMNASLASSIMDSKSIPYRISLCGMNIKCYFHGVQNEVLIYLHHSKSSVFQVFIPKVWNF